MHKKRSVLYTLLHRILFRSRNASWLSSHKCGVLKKPKTLQTRVLQNIERNFTFTRKRTDNEERNEIGVSSSTLNLLKNIISPQSRRNFGERVLSNFLTKTMAAIFDF